MLKITNPTFITSVADKEKFLKSEKPIIAVCGKSNVGKSSFINMLANRNKLAKVSKDPGRTRLVNYFDFQSFILADLPGYGYAKVSKAEKAKWADLLESFFASKQPTHTFALCDIRHDPTQDDMSMIEYLYYNVLPFTIIATKSDKLSSVAVRRSQINIASFFKCGADDIIAVSSQTKQGLPIVLKKIEQLLTEN